MIDIKNEFQEMIPLYLMNQLDQEQKTGFEKKLETDRQLKHELKEFSMIKQSYSKMSEQMPCPSPDCFGKIMENIHLESIEEESKQSAADPWKIWEIWARILDNIKNYFALPKLAWSVAAVQMAVILFLVVSNPNETKFQTLSTNGTDIETGFQVNIIFNDMALEKNIQTLLNDLNASIINGPLENGLYIILIKDTTDKTLVLNTLKASDQVIFVQQRY